MEPSPASIRVPRVNDTRIATSANAEAGPLGLTGYQWLVLLAAWLGWGFDAFDALLFNFVSPLCVPSLLHLLPGDPRTQGLTTYWTGAFTSLLLVGWALGGILFGRITDRLGRTRTLMLTILTYALGTAACALAPNLWWLGTCRFISSLGIGGEWAAGAALVAETVPENRRVQAGALLYTSAPLGLFLATFVNDLFTRQLQLGTQDPDLAWRLVFLTGLVPAALGLAIRAKVHEPEAWRRKDDGERPRLAELFQGELRRRTLGGLLLAMVALLAWWCCNAFLPLVARWLAGHLEEARGLDAAGLRRLQAGWITRATLLFNLGGLAGSLLTAPLARSLGRRPMFAGYFLLSLLSIWAAFAAPLEAEQRLWMVGLVGLSVFGVLGAFSFYLPELFPTRLRGTGAGFCYNTGRVLTAAGPFLIGWAGASGQSPLSLVRWCALAPLLGLVVLATGLGAETRGERIGA
jgi:MFS family permease